MNRSRELVTLHKCIKTLISELFQVGPVLLSSFRFILYATRVSLVVKACSVAASIRRPEGWGGREIGCRPWNLESHSTTWGLTSSCDNDPGDRESLSTTKVAGISGIQISDYPFLEGGWQIPNPLDCRWLKSTRQVWTEPRTFGLLGRCPTAEVP